MSTGRVITFYSYKGGVGRTFLLANTAALLAKWGFKVLCIDFDLEAPGLDRYFRKDAPHTGLLDLVCAVGEGQRRAWREAVQRVDAFADVGGRLHLLGAGRADERYPGRLHQLDWNVLYNQHAFGTVLEDWRADWVADYDLVLVDSRTGHNDIQGICTAQLPDALVALFTCNDQSLDGVVDVVRRARKVRDRLPIDRPWLPVLPVPSRFDGAEYDRLARDWLSVFERRLGDLYADWRHETAEPRRLLELLRVDYKARWSFGEELAVLRERGTDRSQVSYGIGIIAAFIARSLQDSDELVANPDGYVLETAQRNRNAVAPGQGTFEFDFLVSRPASSAFAEALVAEVERRKLTCLAMPEGDPFAALEEGQRRARHLLWVASDDPRQQLDRFGFLNKIKGMEGRRVIEVTDEQSPALAADAVLAALGRTPNPEPPKAPTGDPYRAWLRQQHAQVIPFFPGAGDRLLAQIYVEVEVAPEARAEGMELKRMERAFGGSSTLDALLAREDLAPHRWVILGEPGAGKTTLLRHLARTLAERETGPVPVFLSLALHAHKRPDPIEAAAIEAGADARPTLNAVAQTGDLWLLLDGLDEVAPELQEPTRAWIEDLHTRYPRARIVVASRPIAVSQVGLRNYFEYLRVRPLSEPHQRELLTRLLGANEAAAVFAELQARPTLGSMATSPLLLTMIAMVGREAGARGGGLPTHRVQLYRDVIDLLLRRGHCPEPKGVKDQRLAREVLKRLSLRLHEGGGETWTPEALDTELWAVRADEGLNHRLKETWATNDAFLQDIGHNSGVLGPHDGPQEPWRYLHRSQREFLAAEALAGDADALPRVLGLLQVEDHEERFKNASRWGEVLLLACNLVPEPLVALTAIRDADTDLALRAVADVPTLAPDEALDFLLNTQGWDGEHLLALAQLWREPTEKVAERLWVLVEPGTDAYRLSCLWHVLERFSASFDRFRKQAKLPAPIDLPFVPIPGGTFRMGSTEQESEGPIHEVTLSPFELMATPVTNAEFKSLFGSHRPHIFGKKSDAEGRHPVNTVSWYEAHLFATWAGGGLPTEAQWEYACRAGSPGRWCFGDDEKKLSEYGWFGEGATGATHPVAQKEPNAFGLFDMHGQVWEWCQDWHGAYPTVPQTEPIGPAGGVDRVLRGGSYWVSAVGCRSAGRSRLLPGSRLHVIGFRVLRRPQLVLDP